MRIPVTMGLLIAFRDADDRLARRALAGGERGGCFGEWPYGADDGLEPAVPHSRGEVGEPGAVGFDDEEDCPSVLGLDLGRHDDGDQRATGANQGGRVVEDVSADHVEHDVDLADVLQFLGLQVDEGVDAECERGVPVGGPAGADDAGAGLAGELYRDRADAARGAVDQDGLAGGEVAVVEQALPGGEPGDGQCGGQGVVDVSRQRGEVAGFHRDVLGERAVAGPVGQAEHPLADAQAGGAESQLFDDTGQLVPGHARRPVVACAIGPRGGPVQLSGGDARGVYPHDDVVLGRVGVGHVRQGQPGETGVTVSHGDGLHLGPLLGRATRAHSPLVRRAHSGCRGMHAVSA
ncbi:hypothetical protein SSPO_004850 [Streptomyces antimycoticus]|uniref:Uncharacterized protein n=1 Tax=Streptomyces antimycoticus TaxID=68175 RepID=A0A499UV58_9ACTN|nr:hypothetical protein SSPO_004850 [Streptomyces antimycoticus]